MRVYSFTLPHLFILCRTKCNCEQCQRWSGLSECYKSRTTVMGRHSWGSVELKTTRILCESQMIDQEGEGRGGQHSFTRGNSRTGIRSNQKEGVCPEGMKSVKHFILCVSHWASSKLGWYYCGTLLHLKLQLMINEVACVAYPWSGVSGTFRLSFPSA